MDLDEKLLHKALLICPPLSRNINDEACQDPIPSPINVEELEAALEKFFPTIAAWPITYF